ncbi:MAG: multicopper oxidase family protein [Myxococcales bacterium]|nr:multicopper oxidase family protein [Myxococcales bacterium]
MILALLGCVEPDVADDAHPFLADTAAEPGDQGPTVLPFPVDAKDLDEAEGRVRFALAAQLTTHDVGGVTIAGYGYDGLTPGPVLRARVGDEVTVELHNALAAATTLHWHGMHVPNAMDGVERVQAPILPGAKFTYRYTATSSGTFWIHPHVDTDRQVDLGLYAVVVVTAPAEPVSAHDVVLVFDAWAEVESGLGAVDDHTPPDPGTQVWTVNGAVSPVWTLEPAATARVRLLNASNTSFLSLNWPGARLLATDQGLAAAPGLVDGLVLAPGDRAEVEVLAGQGTVPVTTSMWSAAGGASYGDPRTLLTVVGGDGEPGQPLAFSFSGAAPSTDPGRTDVLYTFAGGAPGEDWLINGEAWPDVTATHVALDADVIIEVRNLSATSHPFHLHGHRFEVLSVDGVSPASQRHEDTIDVPIRAAVRLRLMADNPGAWLVHCHLLGHEEGGMMTELVVE